MLRLPRRIDEQDPLALCKLLWREALANPLHTPGCGCIGGAGLTLHADLLEEDLLDFLEAKHVQSRTVAGLLDQRRSRRSGTFADWLEQALPSLPEAERNAVIDEVNGVLLSVTGLGRSSAF